jgi:hypothetical protein
MTELGAGSNDGGVDLRIYQYGAYAEAVTLVQAKKYTSLPVKLDAVAALYGIAVEERANKGILATTSRFQPKAVKFANATTKRVDLPVIELADAKRIDGWCSEIAGSLNKFFSTGESVLPIFTSANVSGELVGKIVCSTQNYRVTTNSFGIIENEFPREVIIRGVGRAIVSGDNIEGQEIPNPADRGGAFVARKTKGGLFVPVKSERPQVRAYGLWNGEPMYFTLLD